MSSENSLRSKTGNWSKKTDGASENEFPPSSRHQIKQEAIEPVVLPCQNSLASTQSLQVKKQYTLGKYLSLKNYFDKDDVEECLRYLKLKLKSNNNYELILGGDSKFSGVKINGLQYNANVQKTLAPTVSVQPVPPKESLSLRTANESLVNSHDPSSNSSSCRRNSVDEQKIRKFEEFNSDVNNVNEPFKKNIKMEKNEFASVSKEILPVRSSSARSSEGIPSRDELLCILQQVNLIPLSQPNNGISLQTDERPVSPKMSSALQNGQNLLPVSSQASSTKASLSLQTNQESLINSYGSSSNNCNCSCGKNNAHETADEQKVLKSEAFTSKLNGFHESVKKKIKVEETESTSFCKNILPLHSSSYESSIKIPSREELFRILQFAHCIPSSQSNNCLSPPPEQQNFVENISRFSSKDINSSYYGESNTIAGSISNPPSLRKELLQNNYVLSTHHRDVESSVSELSAVMIKTEKNLENSMQE